MGLGLVIRVAPVGAMPAPAQVALDAADLVIGRGAEAGWRLPDPMMQVSGRHCQVGVRGGQQLIVDLGSGNGTWLNGRRLDRPAPLAPGDRIRIGEYEIACLDLAAAPPPPASGGGGVAALLAAAGLRREQVRAPDDAILAAAGALLRRMTAGLAELLAARVRAKAEMGAEATLLSVGGANPLKAARSPEDALAALLAPPQRGIMPAERATEDAFDDLEVHQLATLHAMQGALRATLERFSPDAIRARAAGKGLLARVLPAAREAALWQAYEREFDGVATGSGDAFVELFAKEFRAAYQRLSSEPRRPS